MPNPFHPAIVHFPIALTFILPILILVFAFMIRSHKISAQGWLIIIGLQLVTTVTGYIALESGETEEHQVKGVVEKKFVQQHEESAEIFVGVTVLALVLSIGSYFIRKELQFYLHLGVAGIALIACYLIAVTASQGGDLVWEHGAASVYGKKTIRVHPDGESLLPTPGLNTSESSAEENESLKRDDNDYGNSDEEYDGEFEDFKQED